MILSRKHRFIFLKTGKTAGTSVEIALSKYCGPRDIITRMDEADEQIRRALGYRGPQNLRPPRNSRKLEAYKPHMPAIWISKLAPMAWRDYFKFTIIRNPWDLVASLYYWTYRHEDRKPSLPEFLESETMRKYAPRYEHQYRIGGRIAVDKVCRYERLEEDLEAVRLAIGLPEPLVLPRAKSGFHASHYRDLMTAEDAAVVARLFRFEIDTFGYRF